MKWFLDWRKKIKKAANRLQQWAFYRMRMRVRRAELHRQRITVESRLAGGKLYSKTERFAQIDEVCTLLSVACVQISLPDLFYLSM